MIKHATLVVELDIEIFDENIYIQKVLNNSVVSKTEGAEVVAFDIENWEYYD